jgi:hypothetical protein
MTKLAFEAHREPQPFTNLVRLERGRARRLVHDLRPNVPSATMVAPDSTLVPSKSIPGADLTAPPMPEPSMTTTPNETAPATGPLRDVPVDWEALEDAFENNAPEVHSYLHLSTGDVLRIVDGIADPQMHARIAADAQHLRIDPVSSREQYRWMERFIPMLDDGELKNRLTQAIDGKGAFRRFKDVLMSFAPERERWFAFRSERLRIFMEAWLEAHALRAAPRPVRLPELAMEPVAEPPTHEAKSAERRQRSAEALRRSLRELTDALGPRDLETVVAFAEFLRARRSARLASAPHGESVDGAHDESTAPRASD